MTQQDIEDFGIETWVDTDNRLFLSDPEREGDAPLAFRLPVKAEGKVFAVLIFQYRLTVKATIKSEQEAKRKERAKTAAMRHKLETIPELTKKAQAAFNRYIRLRDREKPCISCGKPLGGEPNSYDAGHQGMGNYRVLT